MADSPISTVAGIEGLIQRAGADDDFSPSDATGRLSEVLGNATASLANNFQAESAFMPPDGQADGYAKMFGEVAEGFSSLFAELNSMRSSYLPTELVQDIPTVTGEALTLSEAVDTQALMESYENTFFRMLGMPSSSDLGASEPLINVEQDGTFVDVEKRYLNYVEDKLDLRQMSRAARPGAPTNAVFNFLKGSEPTVTRLEKKGFIKTDVLVEILSNLEYLASVDEASTDTQAVASSLYSIIMNNIDEQLARDVQMVARLERPISDAISTFTPGADDLWIGTAGTRVVLFGVLTNALELLQPSLSSEYTLELIGTMFFTEVLGESDPSLANLHETQNFWKYSYLLFPPIQDGRIAKCINEPRKMVAAPFSPKLSRTINGRKLKSTLLEAVIRIRLDVISGTTENAPPPIDSGTPPVVVGMSEEPLTYKDISNSMGLLESLIIVRLFTAVQGFAIDVKAKIDSLKNTQHQSGMIPVEGGPVSPDNSQIGNKKQTYCSDDNVHQPGGRCHLEMMKTVEESILLLFGDSDVPEALDLQEGIARNSGVQNAHLMSAVLAIVDIPRRWVQKQIKTKDEEDERRAKKSQDAAAAKISSKLGISKGVGAIDVLVFLLALFTVKEEILLALLNAEQFTDLQAEFSDGFFDELDRSSNTQAAAVNEVSRLAYDAYQLFRFALSKTTSGRVGHTIPVE